MATLDEILGGSPPDGGGHAPKGSQEWAEQNSGENAPVSSSPTVKPVTKSNPSSSAGAPASGGGGYQALLDEWLPKPKTKEEMAAEAKKYKREQLFNLIGDGIRAISNLVFTSQYAPNMYDNKKSSNERARVRYDKLVKDREEKNTAYYNALMRARQADEDAAHRERSWQRQLGLDQEARDRYNEGIQHRNERERIADERYTSEQEYRRGRDAEADRRWQATFDEDKRRSDRSHNFQVRQHNDNVSVRREQARATAARGVRGKQLGFADGNGNQVAIYENVWKGSMQQVYDAMLEDLAPTDETQRRRWEREMRRLDTPQKKEDYVKQNWHKSPKASQIMLTLSGIDPATMTSELNDDVEEYTPGGGDDEVIDYTPGNK